MEFFKGTVTPKDWAFVAVVLTIAGIAAAAFYFVYYKPQQVMTAQKLAELKTITDSLKEAETKARNIEKLREESRQMDTLVELFEKRLPSEREIPQLLAQFESKAESLKLRYFLDQLPNVTDARKETIPYRVRVTGDFHAITTFINQLERDERYLRVSDIDIGEQEGEVSEASFTLSTFRFIQAEEAAATEKAKAAEKAETAEAKS